MLNHLVVLGLHPLHGPQVALPELVFVRLVGLAPLIASVVIARLPAQRPRGRLAHPSAGDWLLLARATISTFCVEGPGPELVVAGSPTTGWVFVASVMSDSLRRVGVTLPSPSNETSARPKWGAGIASRASGVDVLMLH